MEISALTIKILILLLPGAVASIIFEKLTIHKKWNSFQFILNSILFGLISYIIAELACDLFYTDNDFASMWTNLQSSLIPKFYVIGWTIISSIIIGYTCSGIDNYKLINKIGKKIHTSTKYGDENLYSYFMSSPDVNQIYLHDIKNNITYQGWVDAYSETTEIKEIVLRDVKVYSYDDAKFCYEVSRVYLSKPKDEMIIEVPLIN